MNTILTIFKVMHVIGQKLIDLHRAGVDTSILKSIKEVAHAFHDNVHAHHVEQCPDANAKLPSPNDIREKEREV